MNFKLLAILLLTLIAVFRLVLGLVQMRSAANPIPANVADVYDAETYKKWRAYHAEKCRLSMIGHLVSWAVDVLLIAFNVYALFAKLFPEGLYWQMFGVVLLSALTSVVELPFSWYDTMVIEEKYGFNRSTKKTFFMDQLKSFLISLGLICGIGSLLICIHQALGDWMILVFAGVMGAIMLLFAFLVPVFTKIFNKFAPLEEGSLRTRLTELLEKHGYHVKAINVMDASRRSTKSNAYFAGFGKMKTIVLYDTLVRSMTEDEICAVFAHELGHGLHKDTLKNQIMSFARLLVLAFLSWLILRTAAIWPDFGFAGINYGMALILIMSVAYALLAPLFDVPANALFRKAEYRADKTATEEGYGEALISGLKKLGRENFSELAPSPLLVRLEYTHPPLSRRIEAIENNMKK